MTKDLEGTKRQTKKSEQLEKQLMENEIDGRGERNNRYWRRFRELKAVNRTNVIAQRLDRMRGDRKMRRESHSEMRSESIL